LERVQRELPFDLATLRRARDGLLKLDLLAYQPWYARATDGAYQLLSLPSLPSPAAREHLGTEIFCGSAAGIKSGGVLAPRAKCLTEPSDMNSRMQVHRDRVAEDPITIGMAHPPRGAETVSIRN
jgi:hypothetical protein